MAENVSGGERVCFERCYFEAENCYQKEDGTWDCSTKPESCEERCHLESR